MSYTITYRPSVNWDISDAFDYYKAISPKLAKQFLFRIREAKIHITRTPFGFEIKYRDVRTLLLKQFPYNIHYIVDDTNKIVIILATVHSYRNPTDYSTR